MASTPRKSFITEEISSDSSITADSQGYNEADLADADLDKKAHDLTDFQLFYNIG
jgi:hypothetical protein